MHSGTALCSLSFAPVRNGLLLFGALNPLLPGFVSAYELHLDQKSSFFRQLSNTWQVCLLENAGLFVCWSELFNFLLFAAHFFLSLSLSSLQLTYGWLCAWIFLIVPSRACKFEQSGFCCVWFRNSTKCWMLAVSPSSLASELSTSSIRQLREDFEEFKTLAKDTKFWFM